MHRTSLIYLSLLLFFGNVVSQSQTQEVKTGGTVSTEPASANPASANSASTNSSSSDSGLKQPASGTKKPPRAIYAPSPEYSDWARALGVQGTCFLSLTVDEEGKPRDIKVEKGLGSGLDEKAVEAVSQWRFEPAQKDGKPIAVPIKVETTFHSYDSTVNFHETPQLIQRATAGEAEAMFELAKLNSFSGPRAYQFLLRAANQALPEAQFEMGEYTSKYDATAAYMWYELADRSHVKHADKKLGKLASKMSPGDIAEAQKRAEDWQPSKENAPAGLNPQ